MLTFCDIDGQCDLLIACQIGGFHIGCDLLVTRLLLQQLHRYLGRTNPGQGSPWQLLPGELRKQTIQPPLQFIFHFRTITG